MKIIWLHQHIFVAYYLYYQNCDNGEWVYGVPVKSNGLTGICIINQLSHVDGSEYNAYEDDIIPKTIGQFTGLTDKNGTKIFEGDIITCGDSNIKYEVIWNDTGLKAQQVGNLSKIGLQYWIRKIEIIGNIHDKQ